jgi:hypothetical protein
MPQLTLNLKKLEEKFEALFKEETEESFNKWLLDKQQQDNNNMAQQTAKYVLPHMTLYYDGRLYNHKTKKFKKWTKDPKIIRKGLDTKLKNKVYEKICKKIYDTETGIVYESVRSCIEMIDGGSRKVYKNLKIGIFKYLK